MRKSKRYLSEMIEMYGLPTELYTMHRAVKQNGEMRYDITIIPPLIINGHFNKTKGHIHTTGHEEEYIVLSGKALFIFQDKKKIWSIHAKKGDKIIVPGDAHHVTTNPSRTETLKMANWVSDKCIPDYKYLEKMKGMKLYYTTKGWVKNPNYK